MITLQNLTSIFSAEKQSDDLQPIDTDFYDKVRELLASMYARRGETGMSFGARRLLDDEISNIETIEQNIYDKRQMKIIEKAINASIGNAVDTGVMIPAEVTMFYTILDGLRAGRRSMLERSITQNDELTQ